MDLNVLCSIFRNNFAAGRSGMRVARHRRTLNAFLSLSLSRHFSRKCHFRFVPDRIHSRSCSPVIRPARRRIVNSQIVYLDCKPSPSLRPLIADWRRFRDMFASLFARAHGIVSIKPDGCVTINMGFSFSGRPTKIYFSSPYYASTLRVSHRRRERFLLAAVV